jgi:hypothetical protein
MNRVIQGTIHGKIIELREDIGVPDGQTVDVVVTVRDSASRSTSGIVQSAGVAADIPEFDDVFLQIEQERKSAKFRNSG